MGWVTEHPPSGADINTCIQCGLCLPACPTFRLTGREDQSPRGRLTAMAAVDAGAELDATVEHILDTCLGCRACEAICPSLVPYGEIIEAARSEIAEQRGGSRLRRLAVSGALRRPGWLGAASMGASTLQRLRMSWAVPSRLRTGFSGLRALAGRGRRFRGGAWEPDGDPVATIGLQTGCVMDEWFRPVHAAVVDVLTAAGYRVVAPGSQTCCGALAAHDGDRAGAEDMAAVNVAAFADVDLIVSDAAGCGAHLRGYGHLVEGGDDFAGRVRDVTEVVAEAIADGRLPTLPPGGGRVAVQDPCHLRHAQRVTEAPRAILVAAGLEPVEIDPAGLCCGAAGAYSVIHPETSAELGRRKAAQIAAAGTEVVASANPGCEMQLRAHTATRVAHPVELYAEALAAADPGRYRPRR
jgi:glycolate oxidase iron-sulfur subunit